MKWLILYRVEPLSLNNCLLLQNYALSLTSSSELTYKGKTNCRFATMVNDNFKTITSMQFLISTGVMCFNLYRLSLMKINLKFLETVSYTLCLLMQIFYYCWYGNKVKLKVRSSIL